jgi:pimeloyl-ACP methyl ester carboxylesterase
MAEKTREPEMKCQLANLSVHYEIMGEGKPILMISGIPSDHQIILSWMEPIFTSRPGWQRIYFDLPGTGRTPAAGITTIDQVLDVVSDFIDNILPDQPFTLLGLSAGGYLARGYVHRHPERVDGLCLLVPWLSEHENGDLPSPTVISRDPNAMRELSADDAQKLEGLAVLQNQKIVHWYRDVVVAARQLGEGLPLEQYTFSFDMDTHPTPFEKPSLFLLGRQDSHVGYRDAIDILEAYPRATLAVLDRAGHALGIEQEATFHVLVNEWLDRVEKKKGN